MAVSLIVPKIEKTDKLVFQRRDAKAPINPNVLGFFGGSLEGDEVPLEAARRELIEETSLTVSSDELILVGEADVPAGRGPVHATVYIIDVVDADFEVYEGKGLEVYTKEEVLRRSDLARPVRYLLERLF